MSELDALIDALLDARPPREADHLPLIFGKYRHFSPDRVCRMDPSYILWLDAHVRPRVCSARLVSIASEDVAYLEAEADAQSDAWDIG
jgi:hypothetical protein